MATLESAQDLLPRAAAGFGKRVQAVPDGSWDDPTPCDRWSVRDLVGHLVSEHLWAVPLLDGATTGSVGDRFDGDVLGDDPVAAWDAAIEASLACWAHTGHDTVVHLSSGPTSAGEYAQQMLLDLTVHAWDLARGAGLAERLDPTCVRDVLDDVRPKAEQWRRAGIFGDPVDVDSEDPQDQLLGLLGRRP
jgi:uncharacterized protein (TIGR03086 family)